jgi:hypothetical protein
MKVHILVRFVDGPGMSSLSRLSSLGLASLKSIFDESLREWFLLHHQIWVFTKWGLCKITSFLYGVYIFLLKEIFSDYSFHQRKDIFFSPSRALD